MGRDKPKKYSKMGYFEKQEYHDKQAKKYNIDKEDFNTAQGGGGGRYDHYNEGAYKKAIKNAQRNDFDYRTSAQHMDGVKGNANMNDFSNYERKAVKLHKQAGNGGQYSSNKDITGVTNNLVKDDRRAQAKDFKDMYMEDMNKFRSEMEADAGVNQEDDSDPQSFEHSDAVAGAQERVDKYELNLGDNNLFGHNNESAARSDDQTDAARSFVDSYRADVSEAANLTANKERNLNNAAKTVMSYRDQFA